MNKEDFLKQLEDALSGFIVHDQCNAEIQRYIVGTGKEKRFLSVFRTRTKQVEKLPFVDLPKLKEFEVLKNADGLMAMHITSTDFNYRILFKPLENNQILLLCFEEKQGKRRTEYSNFTPTALERYEDYLKGGSNR